MAEQQDVVEILDQATVKAVQAQVEDRGVRAARTHSWCGVFNTVMWEIFPAGPLDGEDWRDSDGLSCNGRMWRDSDGYDRAGRDRHGRDRDGYDVNGLDPDGYDRDGKDVDGFTATDPGRYQYNADGYDREGFNVGGDVCRYLTRELVKDWAAAPEMFCYDRLGRDCDGYDRNGTDRAGYDREGFRNGYDRDGYDRRGFHRDTLMHRNGTGCDEFGFNASGYTSSGGLTDADGFNYRGTHSVTGLDRVRHAAWVIDHAEDANTPA